MLLIFYLSHFKRVAKLGKSWYTEQRNWLLWHETEGLAAIRTLVGIQYVVLEDVGKAIGSLLVDDQVAIEDHGAELPARRQREHAT